MFKWVILVQALVYFCMMPLIRQTYDGFYDAPVIYGAIAFVSLLVGIVMHRSMLEQGGTILVPKKWLSIVIFGMCIAYAYVSIQYGLINRRRGSELMAEIFATLPLWVLLIVRTVEIIFVPVAIIYSKNIERLSTETKVVVFGSLALVIPFMGLIDSRGRLLVIFLSFLIFLKISTVITSLYKSYKLYISMVMALGLFIYGSALRAGSYVRSADYYITEVVRRLDGLNLVTDLRDFGYIKAFGNFDWNMFTPLISKIPFLEAARQAKMEGRTSTKQYLLQDVLGEARLDTSNSLITDPLYFAGIPGVIIAFLGLGYLVAKFDDCVEKDRLLNKPFATALLLSFGLSFCLVEKDFIGTIASIAQFFIICYVLVKYCCEENLLIRN